MIKVLTKEILEQAIKKHKEAIKVEPFTKNYRWVQTDLDCLAPKSLVDKFLKELGYKDRGDMDLNGWQADFWESWRKGEEILYISGCMHDATTTLLFEEYLEED